MFEATWFVYMESSAHHPFAVAFMTPDHPSQPPGPEAFNGKGVFLTLQVAEARAEFDRLEAAGLAIKYPFRDEPESGFWDQYTAEDSTRS